VRLHRSQHCRTLPQRQCLTGTEEAPAPFNSASPALISKRLSTRRDTRHMVVTGIPDSHARRDASNRRLDRHRQHERPSRPHADRHHGPCLRVHRPGIRRDLKTTTHKTNAGGFGCTRRVASDTKFPATTPSKSTSTRTAKPPGSTILRDATERLCKKLIVCDQRASRNAAATLADYDSKTLAHLRPKVAALLNQDPSHPG